MRAVLAGDIPPTVFGLAHGDKLLGAVPTWFALTAINVYFAKKCFGSLLLPWELMPKGQGKPLGAYSTWLKIEGIVYMSLPVAAYFVKIGLAWHDAGPPFSFTGVKFHPCGIPGGIES